MAEKTPRQRRRAQRLRDIREEALNMVIDRGLDGFSVNKLAGRVDLTPGALYRYFDSKDDILAAVQEEVLQGFDSYLEEVLRRSEGEAPLTRITLQCRAYMALEQLQPERFRLIAHLVAYPGPVFADEAMSGAMELILRLLGRLAAQIESAEQQELLTPGSAMRRAVVTWSGMQSLVELRKLARLMPETFEPSVLGDELLRTLLLGWGANEEEVASAVEVRPGLAHFRELLDDVIDEQDDDSPNRG